MRRTLSGVRCIGIAGVLLAALAAAFPQFVLELLGLSSFSTKPGRLLDLARACLATAAFLLGAGLLFEHRVRALWNTLLDRLFAMPARDFWIVAFAAGALLRCLLAWAVPYEPTSDAAWYEAVARSLASGSGVAIEGSPTAYRGPAYAALVALLYAAIGPLALVAWIWGCVASSVLVVSTHALARRWHGDDTARLAAVAASVYPPFVLLSGQLMSDLVFAAGSLALLAQVERLSARGKMSWLAVGVACGFLTLLRGVGLGLVLLLPWAAWWRTRATRAACVAFLLCTIGAAAVLLPWMARNESTLGHFTLATNLGVNLYIGNHAGATGGYELPVEVQGPTEFDADRQYRALAMRYLVDHPLEAVARIPRKMLHFVLLETSAVTSMVQGSHAVHEFTRYLLYVWSQAAYAAVCCVLMVGTMAIPGAWASWSRGASGWMMGSWCLVVTAVFFGADRYRLPLMPMLLIQAAALLVMARADHVARRT